MGLSLSWAKSSRTLGLQFHPYSTPTSNPSLPRGAESCLTPYQGTFGGDLWEQWDWGLENCRGQADRKENSLESRKGKSRYPERGSSSLTQSQGLCRLREVGPLTDKAPFVPTLRILCSCLLPQTVMRVWAGVTAKSLLFCTDEVAWAHTVPTGRRWGGSLTNGDASFPTRSREGDTQ